MSEAPQLAPLPQEQRDDTVWCKACRHKITRQRAAMEGERTFRNPGGYSFHVAPYREAPGARSEGTPTHEASWFPGYAWSLALCAGCGEHLGWWFSGADSFAGLIVTRLLRPA